MMTTSAPLLLVVAPVLDRTAGSIVDGIVGQVTPVWFPEGSSRLYRSRKTAPGPRSAVRDRKSEIGGQG